MGMGTTTYIFVHDDDVFPYLHILIDYAFSSYYNHRSTTQEGIVSS